MTRSLLIHIFVSIFATCLANEDQRDPGESMNIMSTGDISPTGGVAATLYRLVFTKNYGSSYLCTGEIEMYDAMLNVLPTTFKNQSSCFGCATKCEDCTAPYGNPKNQFDGISSKPTDAEIADGSLWSCTTQGSFSRGRGYEYVSFEMSDRPSRIELKRVAAGDYVAKDFILEEFNRNHSIWTTIAISENTAYAANQSADVMESDDVHNAKPFPWGFRKCGDENRTVQDAVTIEDGEYEKLDAEYAPALGRILNNNGYGLQIDGGFGTLTIDGLKYDATQINFQFPSKHKIARADHPANGENAPAEMHILHQSQWKIGEPSRLAIVTVLMTLPQEGTDTSAEEAFFTQVGMTDVPAAGSANAIPGFVDIAVFSKQFNAVHAMPCTDLQRWYVSAEYAHVSGAVIAATKSAFIDSPFHFEDVGMGDFPQGRGQADTNLDFLDWNGEITGWVPQEIALTKEQLSLAYALGDWQNIFEEPTPMPTPVPTYQPVFLTLTVDRIDYNQLVDAEPLRTDFENALRIDIADWANLSALNVQLALKPTVGSSFLTTVEATIYQKDGAMTIPADGSTIAGLGDKILAKIKSITTLEAITSGEVTVEGPIATNWIAPVFEVTAPPAEM